MLPLFAAWLRGSQPLLGSEGHSSLWICTWNKCFVCFSLARETDPKSFPKKMNTLPISGYKLQGIAGRKQCIRFMPPSCPSDGGLGASESAGFPRPQARPKSQPGPVVRDPLSLLQGKWAKPGTPERQNVRSHALFGGRRTSPQIAWQTM